MAKYRILIIEDSSDDTELILIKLREEGIDFIYERVFSSASLHASLYKQQWDLVLSDYIMPGFNGLEAYEIVKQIQPLVSFVLISASIGEPLAVEAMRRGVSDYIMKENLNRLGSVALREIKETRNRVEFSQLRKKFVDEKEKAASILEASETLFYHGILTNDEYQLRVSENCEMITGYTKDELLKIKKPLFFGLVLEGDRPKVAEELQKAISSGEYFTIEYRILKKDGSILWINNYGKVISHHENSQTIIEGHIKDITKTKILQNELLDNQVRLKSILNSAPIGIATIRERKFTYLNPSFCKICGYQAGELMGKDARSLHFTDEEYQRIGQLISELNKDKSISGETIYRHKNGNRVHVKFTITYIDEAAPDLGNIFTIEDVTSKIREEKIRDTIYNISVGANQSENLNQFFGIIREELEELFDTTNFFVALYNPETNLLSFPFFIDEKDATIREVDAEGTLSKYIIDSELPQILRKEAVERLIDDGIIVRKGSPSMAFMGAPLLQDGKPFGIIAIQDYSNPEAFSMDDLQLFSIISEQIAISVNLKRKQFEVEESENRYRMLADASGEIIIISQDGVCIDANQAAVKFLGYTRAEIMNMNILEMVAPDSRERVRKNMSEGNTVFYEIDALRKDGTSFPALVRGDQFIYKGKESRISVARDISFEKKAREEIEHHADDLKFVHQLRDGMDRGEGVENLFNLLNNYLLKTFSIGGNSYFTYSEINNELSSFKGSKFRDFVETIEKNFGIKKIRDVVSHRKLKAFKQIIGQQREMIITKQEEIKEFLGQHLFNLYDEKYHEQIISKILPVLLSELHCMQVLVFPVIDHGKLNGILNICSRDEIQGIYKQRLFFLAGEFATIVSKITSEKQSRLLSKAVQESPLSVLITNKDAQIEYINDTALKLTGYSMKEIIGKNPRIFHSGRTKKSVYQDLWNTLQKGDTWKGEFINKKKTGEIYTESAIVAPIHNEKGEIEHYVGIKEDITERKKLERDLIKARDKAQESDRLKSAFLANMSHEIRTPMNAILGFTDLLSYPELSDQEFKESLHQITTNGHSLLRIINDIIDVSMIEADKMKIYISETEVIKIINEQAANIRNIIDRQKKNVVIHTPKSKQLVLETDPDRFAQIIINLLSNAEKFTSKGSIRIGFEISEENPEVIFSVADTGMGIPKDKQKIIFDRFRQVDDSYSREIGGTGLGLSIVKNLVKKLGGTIWLESEPGKGTTFYFSHPYSGNKNLDVSIPPKQEIQTSVDLLNGMENLNTRRILLVEDNMSNILYIKKIFKDSGVKLILIENGKEVLPYLEKNTLPDIVLLDINLPGKNGVELCVQIKKKYKIPVIAQTAYVQPSDMKNYEKAGFDGVVGKPFKIQDMLNAVRKFL